MFEILLKVSEGKPWKETLLEVLPQRKFKTGRRKPAKPAEGESTETYDVEAMEGSDTDSNADDDENVQEYENE